MNDKRRHPRVQQSNGIAIRVLAEDKSEREVIIMRLTKDISRGGLRFKTEQPLSEGSKLKIYVALDSPRKTVTHFADVVWSKKLEGEEAYSIGVQITDASEDDMDLWDQYIAERLEPPAND